MKNPFGKKLQDCFPLLAWENNCLVSQSADITVLFTLTLPTVFERGVEQFENEHAAWVRALRLLPHYTIVHKQDVYQQTRFEPTHVQQASVSFLQQASDDHFRGRQYLEHTCYVYVTLSSKQNMQTQSVGNMLCQNRIVPKDMLQPHRIADFLDKVAQFKAVLTEAGYQVQRLGEKEVLGSNPYTGLLAQYMQLHFSQPPTAWADLHLSDADFMVGDKYVSAFSLHQAEQLPSQVHTHRMHPAYNQVDLPLSYASVMGADLPFSHIYNQYFFLDNAADLLQKIEKCGRQQASLSGISRQNAINKTFNEAFLNEAMAQGRQAVRCAFNVMLWDTDYYQLLKKQAQVSAALTQIDAFASKAEGIVPLLFWAGIPGAASQYPAEMTFLTFLEQGACFINGETFATHTQQPCSVRLCDRITGIPLSVDLSDLPLKKGYINNRNKFILGPSGSGKSFFTNHLVRQYYEQGSHVVLVDVGDSYKGLCDLIAETTHGEDGIYYTYTDKNPIAFNPFYVADGYYSIEKREQLASLVFCLWKNETETVTKAEETHIADAINGYLQQVTAGACMPSFNTFYDYLQTTFKQQLKQQDVRDVHFDIDNLLQVLRPYYKGGMYDYLLNATQNINLLTKRFIVFEIDNIKDHKTLFPVVTLILMDTFISKMRHPAVAGQRKMILIEEAWKAISKNGTAEFIKYLFKTVRKHFGEAIVVTQEVEDIVGNDIVKNTILSNADCKILLDQRKYAHKFDEIKQTLSLNEHEKALALSLNQDLCTQGRNPYKEVFVTFNGNAPMVYALEVSRAEYWVYTTEKSEKIRLQQAQQDYGSLQNAIHHLVTS
jgi:conjugation system TraG family ATPase